MSTYLGFTCANGSSRGKPKALEERKLDFITVRQQP